MSKLLDEIEQEIVYLCEPHCSSSADKLMLKIKSLAPRWIPVSERLPKHLQEIIFRTEFEILCGEFYLNRFTVLDYDGICFDAEGVTHWMPLPESPEQSE